MPTPSSSSSRRRRRLLAALVVAASVIAAPLTTGTPAGAAVAPLVTTDGIGIRINETAITEVIDDIEADLLIAATSIVAAAVPTYTGVANPDWTSASLDLDVTADFINPAAGAYPQGGLKLTATVDDLLMRMYRYGQWWQPQCLIHVDDTGPLTTEASLRVDTTALPNLPFTPRPSTEDWSLASPNETVAPGYSWLCSNLTTGFDWTGFSDVTDPSSPVAQVLDLVETTLDDLASQMWNDNILPVMDSLTAFAGFGITINQVRTDNNGLIATANVNATNGVTVAGSGPYSVASAVDAGVSSNVNTLLAKQSKGGVDSDIIVSLHPNVTNQYLAAVHDYFGGVYAVTTTSDTIAADLVHPIAGACYTPGDWATSLEAQAPAHVSSTSGIPKMQLPQTTIQFTNSGCSFSDPRVATFDGSLNGIAVAADGSPFSPQGDEGTATWTATRTQADAATLARIPQATASSLVLWARDILGTFLGSVPGHVEMDPIGFTGHPADPSGTGGYTGDQRITETFDVT